MMEGITYEAASLAGTLGLGKLIALYDSNNITIEGSTDIAFTENVRQRFDAMNWHTVFVEDGNDIDAIGKAIEEAKSVTDKPSLIEIKTTIGYGSPNKAGSNASHGAPLGEDEVKATKAALGWKYDESFVVPDEVKTHMSEVVKELTNNADKWDKMFDEYAEKYPELADEYKAWLNDDFLGEIENDDSFWLNTEEMATRQCSEKILNKLSEVMPNLFGGSADLSPSNKSIMKNSDFFSKENREGSNIHFGIREIAMTAMANGMALHGGIRPYIASFFVFSDYVKPMARLSSLMKLPLTYVFTHDSIGVGEDGPTHEPVEQLTMLRAMPNMYVFRPCDEFETKAGWYVAMSSKETPTSLILSRQDLPKMVGSNRGALRGGYIIDDCMSKPDIIIIASGSEVDLAVKAKEQLKDPNLNIRIVSMPCQELFREQSEEYKESILPSCVENRIIVEAGSRLSWGEFAGFKGKYVTMDTFGASGKPADLFKEFHLTVEDVIKAIKEF